MSDTIAVQLDEVAGLAIRLASLGTELAEEAELCRSCADSLGACLAGGPGAVAEEAGRGWAALVSALADQVQEVAAALTDAVAGYRAVDGAAGELVAGSRGYAAVAR